MLKKIYRQDVNVEDINTVGLYIDDEWKYQKESVPIQQFDKISDVAVVIGNGKSVAQFDLTLILPYRESTSWGEVGAWKYKRQIFNQNKV